MAKFRRELPAEGLDKVDVKLWRGNLTIRSAPPGEVGALESDWELDATLHGRELRVKQPLDIKRPLDLADLVGEQQLRIEVGSLLLFDKQVRHSGGDVLVILPASVREVQCRTVRGDVDLEAVEAVAEAFTSRGKVLLSDGRARATAGTACGDITVSGWLGPLQVHTGKGHLAVRDIHGHLEARTGKGEIRIEDAVAGLDVRTGAGNVRAGRIAGHARLSTGHGDLSAIDVAGATLEASTGHGGIILEGMLAGAKVKTGHGDIVCRLADVKGDHEIYTGRGNIILELQQGVATRIDASTRHGGIDSNLPLVRVGSSGPAGAFKQRLVGTTAEGSPTASIRLHDSHGDIRIFQREPVPTGGVAEDREQSEVQAGEEPATAAAPTEGQASDLEMEVLSALGRGELSVDEALALLETAGRDEGDATGETGS